MLVTFVLWLFAGLAAWGYALIFFRSRSDEHDFPSLAPESVAVRLYFGFLLVSFALLATALVTNVSWWLGLAIAVPGIAFAARNLSNVRSRPDTGDPIFPQWTYLAVGLLILAFFVSTAEVRFFDTGLYHQQMAKWLSEYGLVPGITLLQRRFGWTSSWFAAAATLNHGFLRGREAAIIGGLPFALMIVSSAAIAWRSFKVAGVLPGIRGLTWSLFCGLLIVISVAWSIESSLSPDVVIWLLPIMTALLLSEPSGNQSALVGLALLLSLLVFTVKLSAAPVVAYCGLLWLWQFIRVRPGRKILLIHLGLAAAVVLALMAANVRTSGCPFYPSPIGCVSGESSVGAAFAAGVGKEVREFAAYAAKENSHMVLLVTAALAGTLLGLLRLWNHPFVRHGLAVSWCGIFFILVSAPNPRFGLGYLLLPTTISLAILLQWMLRRWPTLLSISRRSLPWAAAAVPLLFLVFSIHAMNSPVSLLLPARMPSADGDPIHIVTQKFNFNIRTTLSLTTAKDGNVLVVVPQWPHQCWDAALPCTGEVWQSIELKDPTKGLRGGFRWSSGALQPVNAAVGH